MVLRGEPTECSTLPAQAKPRGRVDRATTLDPRRTILRERPTSVGYENGSRAQPRAWDLQVQCTGHTPWAADYHDYAVPAPDQGGHRQTLRRPGAASGELESMSADRNQRPRHVRKATRSTHRAARATWRERRRDLAWRGHAWNHTGWQAQTHRGPLRTVLTRNRHPPSYDEYLRV